MEARLRQLEGKQLSSEAAKPRGLPGAEKYEGARAAAGAGGGALLGQGKAYNADADVAMAEEDGEKKKKKKKVRRRGGGVGWGGGAVAEWWAGPGGWLAGLAGLAGWLRRPVSCPHGIAFTHTTHPQKDKEAAAEEPQAEADGEKKKKKKKRDREGEEEAANGTAADGEKKVSTSLIAQLALCMLPLMLGCS